MRKKYKNVIYENAMTTTINKPLESQQGIAPHQLTIS